MLRIAAQLITGFVSLAILQGGFIVPARAGGLTFAHGYPENSSIGLWAQEYSACAQEVGQIYVEVFPGGSLGRSQEIVESVMHGQIDMAIVPAWALQPFWPAIATLSVPGIVEDPRVLTGVSGEPELMYRVERTMKDEIPLRLLGIGWRPAILVGTQTSLDDLTGAKVRSYDTATANVLQALGATPTQIPSAEVFTALEYGVTDGALVGLDAAEELLTNGGASSIILAEDFSPFAAPLLLVMNASVAEVFGAELPESLQSECRHAGEAFNSAQVERLAKLTQTAEQVGADILRLDDDSRSPWRDAFDFAMKRSLEQDDGRGLEIHQAFQDFAQTF